MLRWVGCWLAALCLWTAAAHAEPDEIRRARALFAEGTRQFDAGSYAAAIASYQAAYELVPRPVLLYNIGRAYERKGEREAAVRFYRKYLAAEPEGQAATDAATQLAALVRALEAERPGDERRRDEAAARARGEASEAATGAGASSGGAGMGSTGKAAAGSPTATGSATAAGASVAAGSPGGVASSAGSAGAGSTGRASSSVAAGAAAANAQDSAASGRADEHGNGAAAATAPASVAAAPPAEATRGNRATGVLSWVSLGVGVGAAAAGAALLAIDGTGSCSDAGKQCPNLWDTRTGGAVLAAGGGALLVTSVVLFIVHRRGRARVALAPAALPRALTAARGGTVNGL